MAAAAQHAVGGITPLTSSSTLTGPSMVANRRSRTPTGRNPDRCWGGLQPGEPQPVLPGRRELVVTENPFAVIFGCADSRLAAEIIFDVGLGAVTSWC
jgi:hypothetical protein